MKLSMKKEIIPVLKIKNGKCFHTEDEVALEKHFSVKLNGEKTFSLSCTPEFLEELVLGRLYTGGFIHEKKQVKGIRILWEQGEIQVGLNSKITSFTRAGYKNTDNRKKVSVPEPQRLFQIAEEIFENPGGLFRDTGCAHSCALYLDGQVVCRFEDIGRHNALDKVIGSALKKNLSLSEAVVFTSGRISGDYLEKIIRAGVSVVASRAAVTSEAVKTAGEKGILMYGFVRGGSGNCYTPL